jgi:hypothetical protein
VIAALLRARTAFHSNSFMLVFILEVLDALVLVLQLYEVYYNPVGFRSLFLRGIMYVWSGELRRCNEPVRFLRSVQCSMMFFCSCSGLSQREQMQDVKSKYDRPIAHERVQKWSSSSMRRGHATCGYSLDQS